MTPQRLDGQVDLPPLDGQIQHAVVHSAVFPQSLGTHMKFAKAAPYPRAARPRLALLAFDRPIQFAPQ